MNKHTPGPWNCLRASAGGREIITSENAPVDICVLSHKDKTPPEINANALLIAAAPELLQAALNFVEWFECGRIGEKPIAELHQACAAIAKARGEA